MMPVIILSAAVGFLLGFLALLAYAAAVRTIRKRKRERAAAADKGEPPPRLEFAQKFVFAIGVFAMVIVTLTLGANFFLLWNDKIPMPEETITTVTVFGVITSTMAFSGYAALTAVRNCSINKLKRYQASSSPDQGQEENPI